MSRCTPCSAYPSRQAGLTLLELVVALSLVGLIGLVLSSNVSFGSRVWEYSQSGVSEARKAAIVARRIAALVSSARAPDPLLGGQRVAFTGNETSLQFRTAPPRALARGESRDLILQFTRNKRLLELIILPMSDQISNPAPGNVTPMLDNVEDFRIRYLGLGPDTVGGTWSNLWNGRIKLPELVEFTLIRNGKSVVFSAVPRVRGTVGCLLLDVRECDTARKNRQ